MISLDNTYNAGELKDFDVRVKKVISLSLTQSIQEKEIEYALEYKFDGLGVELIYEN
jgi:DNA ligase (NAD+)